MGDQVEVSPQYTDNDGKLGETVTVGTFDERYAGEHFGAPFGKGVCFAHNASKSDICTSPDPNGILAMFLSRVCLGGATCLLEVQLASETDPF